MAESSRARQHPLPKLASPRKPLHDIQRDERDLQRLVNKQSPSITSYDSTEIDTPDDDESLARYTPRIRSSPSYHHAVYDRKGKMPEVASPKPMHPAGSSTAAIRRLQASDYNTPSPDWKALSKVLESGKKPVPKVTEETAASIGGSGGLLRFESARSRLATRLARYHDSPLLNGTSRVYSQASPDQTFLPTHTPLPSTIRKNVTFQQRSVIDSRTPNVPTPSRRRQRDKSTEEDPIFYRSNISERSRRSKSRDSTERPRRSQGRDSATSTSPRESPARNPWYSSTNPATPDLSALTKHQYTPLQNMQMPSSNRQDTEAYFTDSSASEKSVKDFQPESLYMPEISSPGRPASPPIRPAKGSSPGIDLPFASTPMVKAARAGRYSNMASPRTELTNRGQRKVTSDIVREQALPKTLVFDLQQETAEPPTILPSSPALLLQAFSVTGTGLLQRCRSAPPILEINPKLSAADQSQIDQIDRSVNTSPKVTEAEASSNPPDVDVAKHSGDDASILSTHSAREVESQMEKVVLLESLVLTKLAAVTKPDTQHSLKEVLHSNLIWRWLFMLALCWILQTSASSDCIMKATRLEFTAPRNLHNHFSRAQFDNPHHPVQSCSDAPQSDLAKSLRMLELNARSYYLKAKYTFMTVPTDQWCGLLEPGKIT